MKLNKNFQLEVIFFLKKIKEIMPDDVKQSITLSFVLYFDICVEAYQIQQDFELAFLWNCIYCNKNDMHY